ncbi:MAG: hypothetical protein P1Q69_18630 [Candidatus Thorarchaeota archaeon]|nr:hypothetical protein [Candidatus Thorarchaeota archaeon]
MKSGRYSVLGLVLVLGFLLIVNSATFVPLVGTSIRSDDSKNTVEMEVAQVIEHAQRAMPSQFYENLGQVQNSDILFYGDVSGIGI